MTTKQDALSAIIDERKARSCRWLAKDGVPYDGKRYGKEPRAAASRCDDRPFSRDGARAGPRRSQKERRPEAWV